MPFVAVGSRKLRNALIAEHHWTAEMVIKLKTNADGVFEKGEGEKLAKEALIDIKKDNPKLHRKVVKIVKSMEIIAKQTKSKRKK